MIYKYGIVQPSSVESHSIIGWALAGVSVMRGQAVVVVGSPLSGVGTIVWKCFWIIAENICSMFLLLFWCCWSGAGVKAGCRSPNYIFIANVCSYILIVLYGTLSLCAKIFSLIAGKLFFVPNQYLEYVTVNNRIHSQLGHGHASAGAGAGVWCYHVMTSQPLRRVWYAFSARTAVASLLFTLSLPGSVRPSAPRVGLSSFSENVIHFCPTIVRI